MKTSLINLVIIFSLLLLWENSSGQGAPDTLWTRTYESGMANCVIETSDSCYLAVGGKEDSLGNVDLYLAKTNSLGDLLWSKTIGDIGFDCGSSIRQISDNSYIVLGSTTSNEAGKEDVWLIKMNANGDKLWTKTFGGDSSDVGTSIQIINDEGFIILGTTKSYGAGGEDAWLIKTDSNGIIQWTKTFGGTADDQGNCIQLTSDGGYILGGGSESYGGAWLIKTDSRGDTSWTKTYTLKGIGDGSVKSVIKVNDGYIFAGSVGNGGIIIKTDFSGDTLWTKLDGRIAGHVWRNSLHCVIQTSNDLYLFAQSLWRLQGGDFYYHVLTHGGILALDKNGTEILAHTICSNPNGEGCGIYSVIQVKDNSYLVSGSDGKRFFLAKLGYSITNLKLSNDIITNELSLSQNYPNPFNPLTTIEFSLPKSEFVTLKIYNILGEEVTTLVQDKLRAGNHTCQFDGSNLASGVYLYRIKAGEFCVVKKMILLR